MQTNSQEVDDVVLEVQVPVPVDKVASDSYGKLFKGYFLDIEVLESPFSNGLKTSGMGRHIF
jgi:hypothetical protein